MAEPLDFAKIDRLRQHMLLSTSAMAKLLDTSRQNYYNWLGGAVPRGEADVTVRKRVRQLVHLAMRQMWPTDQARATKSVDRLPALMRLLDTEELS